MEAFSEVFELEDWGDFLCDAFHVLSRSSRVQLFATPWMVAHQAPLSMGFFRQKYWSRLPIPSPGDLPDPRIEPASPSLASGFFTNVPLGKPMWYMSAFIYMYVCVHIHMYVCMHIHMYVCMHIHMHVCAFICMSVCTFMYVCTFICMYAHSCVCMYGHSYVCIHAHSYVCVYAHSYVCMHAHSCVCVHIHVCVCTFMCMYVCIYAHSYDLGYSGFQKQLIRWTTMDHNKLENSERDGNTRPPDLPLEKPVCRSGSNS